MKSFLIGLLAFFALACATAAPQNVEPTAWAVFFQLEDRNGKTQELFWDYTSHPIFGWERGAWLIWKNADGINERIAICEEPPANYPGLGGKTVQEFFIADCIRAFNDAIERRFGPFDSVGGHPVDETIYQALVVWLQFNPATRQFE